MVTRTQQIYHFVRICPETILQRECWTGYTPERSRSSGRCLHLNLNLTSLSQSDTDINVIYCLHLYTVSGKKDATLFFAITLPNPDRSSKFFYRHTQQKICNKEIIKYPTNIYPRRYATL